MKNSPHRAKHQVNKAVRKSKTSHPLPEKKNPLVETAHVAESHNQLVPLKERLKPLDHDKMADLLAYFKKHFEKVRLDNKPHHSKRTNPGLLDSDPPYFHAHPKTETKVHKKIELAMRKSLDVSRKVMKDQSRKRAA